MTIEREYSRVDDKAEIDASHRIIVYFNEFREWQETFATYMTAQPNSPLFGDDSKMPTFPVSQYAYSQIMGAFGVLDALESMMVKTDEVQKQLIAGPYGIYPLIRNALDSAALAVWLLEPLNSKLRIKRRLRAQMDEIWNAAKFREAVGAPSHPWAKSYRLRMQEVADATGSGTGTISNWRVPAMTKILKDIERHNDEGKGHSWLAAWQLCSGHAHGKQWAILASNELNELPGTATEIGATFWNTASYMHIDLSLHAARNLIHTACERYTELSKSLA